MSAPNAEPSITVLGDRRRTGRNPRAGIPSKPLSVRLSPDEFVRVKTAAEANHQDISTFMRDALVTAADDTLEPLS